jgi:TrmH family RNA methyltransferase
VEQVTSRSNPLIRRFREAAREGRLDATVLLDGPHLLEEARRSNVEVEVVAFGQSFAARHAQLADSVVRSGVRSVIVPDGILETLTPVRQPRGVVALARLQPVALEDAVAANPPQLILVLESVQDPGNVGAVIRTAEACGGTAVLTAPGCADPLGWKALRGGMGSTFRLPVTSTPTSVATAAMRRAGVRMFAAVPRGGAPLHLADLTGPAAVLLGGEGPGLSSSAIDAADERITIAMRPPVESLNVSIAAALILYEASRQRANVAVR